MANHPEVWLRVTAARQDGASPIGIRIDAEVAKFTSVMTAWLDVENAELFVEDLRAAIDEATRARERAQ